MVGKAWPLIAVWMLIQVVLGVTGCSLDSLVNFIVAALVYSGSFPMSITNSGYRVSYVINPSDDPGGVRTTISVSGR